MQKLTDARNHLLASGLDIKARDLLTFAEKGSIVAYQGTDSQNRNFKIQYVAHLIITDYAGDPQNLLFVMTDWIDANVPDRNEEALKFHVDVISTKSADVSIQIELSDTITVEPVDGGTNLDHQPDADVRAIDMGNFYPDLD
ncbi:MAG: phage tail protein [Thalassospira sp.]|uniref:phage tail protein n=1 Tax=Thalassospira sp. 11-3 TaxID=2135614 RepID=UPI000D879EC1|nr:phage tail protein [Thalassospira sp. 11-3]MBL4839922.1 phage tail protein [Thalassospira sp.]PXX30865.1 tail completion protein R (GpR) [Thalassospira sp. 11-3]